MLVPGGPHPGKIMFWVSAGHAGSESAGIKFFTRRSPWKRGMIGRARAQSASSTLRVAFSSPPLTLVEAPGQFGHLISLLFLFSGAGARVTVDSLLEAREITRNIGCHLINSKVEIRPSVATVLASTIHTS